MKRVLPIFLCLVACAFFLPAKTTCVTATSENREIELRLGEKTYTFFESEIGGESRFNLSAKELIKKVHEMGFSEDDVIKYVYPGLKDKLDEVCGANFVAPQDSVVEVNSGTPKVIPEVNGVMVDREKLEQSLYPALFEDQTNVVVWMKTKKLVPNVTAKRNENLTHQKSEFTTYITGENQEGRINNIKVALDKFNGFTLGPGETLCFNELVGETTAENGFMPAKVIYFGKYAEDYGGGVCQAATTIYNAALMAGLEIKKVRPHSLKVGYVLGSFDAMVSSFSDLVIKNPYDYPVFFYATATDTDACVKIFGAKNEYDIVRRNERKEIGVEEMEDIAYKSDGYLDYYKDGELVKSILIRSDAYKKLKIDQE